MKSKPWKPPGSPLGTAAPDLGWSIPSASGPTGFGARAITPPYFVKRRDPLPRHPVIAKPDRLPASWDAFARDLGISLPAGKALSFGPSWFWAPEELPDLTGLRVLRPGLELGQCRGDRLLPAHALALWLSDAPRIRDLDPASPEAVQYLAGEELRGGGPSGWTLVTAGGLSLGWGKGSGDVLKNHYPKGLRRRSS